MLMLDLDKGVQYVHFQNFKSILPMLNTIRRDDRTLHNCDTISVALAGTTNIWQRN